jgi:hypothetical protein
MLQQCGQQQKEVKLDRLAVTGKRKKSEGGSTSCAKRKLPSNDIPTHIPGFVKPTPILQTTYVTPSMNKEEVTGDRRR